MHGAGKLGLASLRNLDQLPPTGAVVIAAPLKIVNGSGSRCGCWRWWSEIEIAPGG
jgi:kynurenine formamidase